MPRHAQYGDDCWHEPDHGIWEIRKPRRHHVHSKVMCWLAVDRGIQISERFLDRKKPAWEKLRQTIAEDINLFGLRACNRRDDQNRERQRQ